GFSHISAPCAFSNTFSIPKEILPVPSLSFHRYSPWASAINWAAQLFPCAINQMSLYIAPLRTVGLLISFLANSLVFKYSFYTCSTTSFANSYFPYMAPTNLIHSAFPKGVVSTQSLL